MNKRTDKTPAIVLGASGSVGAALVAALLRDARFDPIIVVARRPAPEVVAAAHDAGKTLHERIVPEMTPAALEAATVAALDGIEGDVEGLSTLGIGARTGKITVAEHRAVDVELNAAFARGLQSSGRVRHLGLMTAIGADPTASETGGGAAGGARYNRVKGEAEEAVRAVGPSVVSVFRPAMIIGSRHTPGVLEKVVPVFSFITPKRFKSITVDQIAKAMIAVAMARPESSAVYHYPEMMEAIRRDQASTT